jgi:hypothetical protein
VGEEGNGERHGDAERDDTGKTDSECSDCFAEAVAPVGLEIAPIRAGACCCRRHVFCRPAPASCVPLLCLPPETMVKDDGMTRTH